MMPMNDSRKAAGEGSFNTHAKEAESAVVMPQ
jgi:hypothetical protein